MYAKTKIIVLIFVLNYVQVSINQNTSTTNSPVPMPNNTGPPTTGQPSPGNANSTKDFAYFDEPCITGRLKKCDESAHLNCTAADVCRCVEDAVRNEYDRTRCKHVGTVRGIFQKCNMTEQIFCNVSQNLACSALIGECECIADKYVRFDPLGNEGRGLCMLNETGKYGFNSRGRKNIMNALNVVLNSLGNLLFTFSLTWGWSFLEPVSYNVGWMALPP